MHEQRDLEQLRQARQLLENPSLAARISDRLGRPIERGFELLPARWSSMVNEAARKAIEASLGIAINSLSADAKHPAGTRLHQTAATLSGAAGGAFGLMALTVELPISTTIMLRSIADIARAEGENLNDPESRLQCMHVLALGGTSDTDDAAEVGYFTARAALARVVSEAASHVARKGLADASAPALVRLISQVASRYSIVVSEKVALQAVPVLGALGGAAINAIFINHFQDIARGHFTVRRLERRHGSEWVHQRFAALSEESLSCLDRPQADG